MNANKKVQWWSQSIFHRCTKLVNVLVFCFRFIENCKYKKCINAAITSKPAPKTFLERTTASNLVISYVQNIYFNNEIICLKENKSLPNKGPLSALCAFIDKDRLLRVGGPKAEYYKICDVHRRKEA